MNKKFLIIAESIAVDKSSGAKTNRALIKNLIACGYYIKILHYNRETVQIDGAQVIPIKERKRFYYYIGKAILVFHRITSINLNKWLQKVRGFSFLFTADAQSIASAINKYDPIDYDWIMTLSIGTSFRTHAALLKCEKWHSKWLSYVHDPFPYTYFPEPYRWDIPGHHKMEQFIAAVFNSAAYQLFPSKLLAQHMIEKTDLKNTKHLIIPHQLTDEMISTAASYSKNNVFTLVHAGNLMGQRPPNALVEGAKIFSAKYTDKKFELVLIGNYSQYATYLEKAASDNEWLKLLGSLPFKDALSYQYSAHINVIIEADAVSSPFLPGKIVHCAAAGSAILHIAPHQSEVQRIDTAQETVHAVHDAQAIALKLEQLYSLTYTIKMENLQSYLSNKNLKTQIEQL